MHSVLRTYRVVRAGALAAAVVLSAAPACAFRTLEDDPTLGASGPVVWETSTIQLALHEPPAGAIDVVRLEHAIESACLTWSSIHGATVTLVYAGRTSEPARPGDGVNTIEIVAVDWDSLGLPGDVGGTTDLQLRRTTDETGVVVHIVEGDIYLDFEHHDWSFAGSGGSLDVAGIVTHELGHLLSLEHVCLLDGPPMCTGTAEEMASAMYPLATGSSQRWLSDDDAAGIRYLYPADCDCPPDQRCELGRCVAECASPPCDGTCTSDAQCTVGSCAIGGPAAGVCIAPAGYRAECGGGADCASGLCLTTAAHSFCTVGCLIDSSCGEGMECVLVQGSRVCAPAPRSGCAVAPRGRPAAGGAWPGLVVLLSWSVSSARRRRMRR